MKNEPTHTKSRSFLPTDWTWWSRDAVGGDAGSGRGHLLDKMGRSVLNSGDDFTGIYL